MIRVGIGGWVFKPWRGTFYPPGLPQARELEHASRALTTIEINGTFYGSQKPESFRRWAEQTPDDFIFSLKGPRFTTHRAVLAEAGPSVERFLGSGVLELKSKLGPILWQLPPTKAFAPDDLAAFLSLLPHKFEGHVIRHAVEVRHQSFCSGEFVALMRKFGVSIVLVDSEKHPLIADVTADFLYLRLQRTAEEIETGYAAADLKTWGKRAHAWEAGGVPADLSTLAPAPAGKHKRDVFIYMISGAKVRAPAAAQALLKELR
ncbi:MAG TPA: DUF72 domain-containing protein [Xanthobacteraceae bacterium]|nr:DUF72 domain-containing protein [Xanthobacteraceae bacterium]